MLKASRSRCANKADWRSGGEIEWDSAGAAGNLADAIGKAFIIGIKHLPLEAGLRVRRDAALHLFSGLYEDCPEPFVARYGMLQRRPEHRAVEAAFYVARE